MATGPFFPLADAVLGLTPTNFGFLQFTQDNLAETDSTAAEIDSTVLDVLTILDDNPDPAPEFDYFGLVDSLAATNFDLENGYLGNGQDAVFQGDSILTDAVATAPDVAFLPQPPPFDPTADPTVNLNFGTGAQTPTDTNPPSNTGTGRSFNTLVTAPGYDLTLVGTTSLAPTSFFVGDHWTLTIAGPPLQLISLDAWHDGVHIVNPSFGQFDGNGIFTLSGVMDFSQVGAWSQTFYGGPTLIQEVAYFVVAPPA